VSKEKLVFSKALVMLDLTSPNGGVKMEVFLKVLLSITVQFITKKELISSNFGITMKNTELSKA